LVQIARDARISGGRTWGVEKEILAHDPAAVIFTMTGKDGAEDLNEVARMIGARRGFRKPVGMYDLLAAIAEVAS